MQHSVNDMEARRLYGLAAAQGDAKAQYNLGAMHYHGQGGPKDEVEARRLYGLAAAQGIAQRVGLGKTRHVAVHLLWIQQHMRNKTFELHKVKGTMNPADLFTKAHLT